MKEAFKYELKLIGSLTKVPSTNIPRAKATLPVSIERIRLIKRENLRYLQKNPMDSP